MRYKEVLSKYGLTQNELAERLGINRVSVSRLLSDKNDMRISTATKIANAIGCQVGELFDAPTQNNGNSVICPRCGAKLSIKVEE